MTYVYLLFGLMFIQLLLFSFATGLQWLIFSGKFPREYFHRRDICTGIGFLLMYVQAVVIARIAPDAAGNSWIAGLVLGLFGAILLDHGLRCRKALQNRKTNNP